jgi:hypothetical protein
MAAPLVSFSILIASLWSFDPDQRTGAAARMVVARRGDGLGLFVVTILWKDRGLAWFGCDLELCGRQVR